MMLMLTFSVVPAFAADEVKSPEATVVAPTEAQPVTSVSEKGKTTVVTTDSGSKSPQTGSDNTIPYVVLLASTAVCCATVIKYSKSK